MQITLAQALKEKNRISGEISRLWGLVAKENSCKEGHTRCIDVLKAREQIEGLTAKLIELKTKIGKANEGNLRDIYTMEECKNKMKRLAQVSTIEGAHHDRYDSDEVTQYTVEITAKEIVEEQHQLQLMCNRLQDAMDLYNATHKIEFDTPLTK